MPIRRGYTPPFQTAAPKLGADDMGRTVKGLVNVEIQRTNEISFAVESFGCDGKPVLSMLRDLPCEATGKLVVAGTKNGMPFKLNSDLPRGIGSAIRGSGGAMRTVSSGAAYRISEWVIYDNVGNYWSLDELTGGEPTYRGETPIELDANETTPAVCTQRPRIRPYEKRWEYPECGGDPEVCQPAYLKAGCGWQEDTGSPIIAFPVAGPPYVAPSSYHLIQQWVPDETTPPPGASGAAAWPDTKRRLDVEWYPALSDEPHDWDAVTENSMDIIVSKYPVLPPWRVSMNQFTRPLVEHISTGGLNDELHWIICVERNMIAAPYQQRIALRGRSTTTLVSGAVDVTLAVSGLVMFTPDVSEGWLMETGAISGSSTILRRFRSRASSADPYGSALTELDSLTVTLPEAHAHDWTEPVWFRVGKVTRLLGTTPTVTPRLPLWR